MEPFADLFSRISSSWFMMWDLAARPAPFVVLIAFLTVWYGFTYFRELGKARARLNRFLRDVEDRTRVQLSEIRDLDQHFRSAGVETLWNEYKRQLNDSTHDTGHDPMDIFTTDAILSEFTNRHNAELVPGRLTAIGVLGTFVGLTHGLFNLDIATDEGVKSSIELLMDGMGTAFWSSIAGIAASLVWAAMDRGRLYKTEKVILRFQNRLQTLLPYEELDSLLRRMANDQREHLESFKKFASDVLIPQIVDGLADSVRPHFQQTAELVERLGNQSVENQTRTLNHMVTHIVEQFTSAFGGQINELADTMKELSEWQKATKQELSDLLEEIQTQAQLQHEVLQHANGMLTGVTELSAALFEELQKFQSTMGTIQDSVQTTAHSFTLVVHELEEARNHTVAEMQKLIDAQQASVGALGQLSAELQQQSERLERLSGATNEQISRLSELLHQEVQTAVNHIHSGLSATFRAYDESLAQATTRLREVVHTLYESVMDIPDEANRIGSAIRDLSDTMNRIADNLQQRFDALNSPAQNALPAPATEAIPEVVKEATDG